MVRQSKTCSDCGYSFYYDETAGTGPAEVKTEGECPNCGRPLRTPPDL